MSNKPIRRPLVWLVMGYVTILSILFTLGPEHKVASFLYGKNREQYAEGTQATFHGQLVLVERNSAGYRVEIKVRSGEWRGLRLSAFWEENVVPLPGMLVDGEGVIYLPERAGNEGQFDEWLYYKTKSVDYLLTIQDIKQIKESRSVGAFFYQFKGILQERVWQLLPEKEAGLVCSILLGSDEMLDVNVKQLFQEIGIAHILAISGLHVMMLYKGLKFVLDWLLGKRVAIVCGMIILWGYCLFSGNAISTVRATLMLTIHELAWLLYQKEDWPVTIALTAGILLVKQPLYLLSAGFQLSFSAVIGLRILPFLLGRIFWIPGYIRKMLSTSISASLATGPICVWHFFQISPYAFLLNLIVVPLMGFVFLFSVLGCVLCWISAELAMFCMGPVFYILQLFQWLGQFVRNCPGSVWTIGRPGIWQVASYYTVMVISVWWFRQSHEERRILQKSIYIVVLGLIVMLFPWKIERQVAFLNVGQGDCSVIQWEGEVFIVDAGPSYEEVIRPYLLFYGITEIDGFFLSHPDTDHMEGLELMLEDDTFSIETLYISAQAWEEKEKQQAFLKKTQERSIFVQYLQAREQLQMKTCVFQCVSPRTDIEYTSDNEASLAFRLLTEKFSVLFTGDMELQAENNAEENFLEADILKVAHHGSSGSSNESFLQKVNPIYGIISSKKSVYGHPHEETLQRLLQQGIAYIITEDAGAITVAARGKRWFIDTFR